MKTLRFLIRGIAWVLSASHLILGLINHDKDYLTMSGIFLAAILIMQYIDAVGYGK